MGHHWARSNPNRRPKGGSGIASWSIPSSKVATDSVPGSDENGGSSEAPAPANKLRARSNPAVSGAGRPMPALRAPPPNKGSKMKNSLPELLRIEGADLDAITMMPNRLPMRLGKQIAGRARIDQLGDRFVLDVGGETKKHFIAKRFVFPEHIQKSFCLLCAKCKRWRRRLFLNDVSFGPLAQNFTHSLECKECIASAETKKKRLPKSYAKRPVTPAC